MPEEHNRVLTDHAADLLLAPTELAVAHLEREGLGERTRLVGDVMTDVLLLTRNEVLARSKPSKLPKEAFYLATIHRPDNTDNPERLSAIVHGLAKMNHPVVLVAHPRLVAAAQKHSVELSRPGIQLRSPMGYTELVQAVIESAGVVTDSGGLQKEAFLLSRPTVTLRSETEWPETISLGGNVLHNEDFDDLYKAIDIVKGYDGPQNPYGDGQAARRATSAIEDLVDGTNLL
jgi:UDP-N-acetylglucosamine 2-epimerase (non-hydrolysing)